MARAGQEENTHLIILHGTARGQFLSKNLRLVRWKNVKCPLPDQLNLLVIRHAIRTEREREGVQYVLSSVFQVP